MGFLEKLFGSKKAPKPEAIPIVTEDGAVYAPATGKVEPMDTLPDPVFASGAMGPCLGVWPVDGNVYAPISGTITAAMPHAFGFVGDDGLEVLIHVGVDTVNMKGYGFIVHVRKDEHVTAGAPILTFDRAKVAKAGYDDVVMTIITNAADYAVCTPIAKGTVTAGSKLFQTA